MSCTVFWKQTLLSESIFLSFADIMKIFFVEVEVPFTCVREKYMQQSQCFREKQGQAGEFAKSILYEKTL